MVEPPGTALRVLVDHSIIGDRVTVSGQFGETAGNLAVDPRLVMRDGLPHLSAGSPAIDAGTCDLGTGTDFDGDPRPTGPACDIGADEFVP